MQDWDNTTDGEKTSKPKLPPEMKAYFAAHPSKAQQAVTVTRKRDVMAAFLNGTQARYDFVSPVGSLSLMSTGKKLRLDDLLLVENTGDHEVAHYVLSSAFRYQHMADNPIIRQAMETVLLGLQKRGFSAATISGMIAQGPPPEMMIVKDN